MTLRKTIATLGILTLTLAVSPAMAEKGKSNGNGHGNSSTHGASTSHGNAHDAKGTSTTASTKPGKGGLASELKGLNAVKANSNALENASPNSQVGRIALYRDAALATKDLATAQQEAADALAALPVPTATLDDVDAAIAGLDPAAEGYAEALAALTAEREDIVAYNDALAVVADADLDLQAAEQTEEAALLTASGGRILSDEAIAYIRGVLNL